MTMEGMGFQIPRLTCREETRRILSLVSARALGVREIAESLGMPIARCYRRVREMEDRGLLKRDGVRRDGMEVYRSNLKKFFVRIEGEHLSEMVEFEDGRKVTFELDIGPTMGEA